MKFGHTDIEPADRRFAVNQAKSHFLEAICQNSPEVLEHLSSIKFISPSALCVKSVVLRNWAERWNLNTEWILETACQTIQTYQLFPQNEALIWFPPSFGWKVSLNDLAQVTPPIGLPVWEADSTPRAYYIEKAEVIINEKIEEGFFSDLPAYFKPEIRREKLEVVKTYCDTVLNAYLDLKDSEGNPLWIATKEKANLKRNAGWAVKFQVLEMGFSEIAENETIKRPTIQKEIESFLKIIDLERRETPLGRTKGKKDDKLSWRQSMKNAQIKNPSPKK